jgi:hypothetical protein
MTRPKIAVLDVNEADPDALPRSWEKLVPVDFVAMASTKDLLRELQRQRFDAIIVHCATTMPDGSPLWAELSVQYPSVPVAIWGDCATITPPEGRVAPITAIDTNAGLVDFLSAEVISVTRGRLSGVSLPSVVQVLQMEQRTCRLRVRANAAMGELFVRNGALVHASLRKMPPLDAALELLSWTDADVVFDRLPAGITHTIEQSLDFLVIEAARVRDENNAGGAEAHRVTSSLSASTESWLVPAVLRGDAEALVQEVMNISGATACAVIDFENRLLVSIRTRRSESIPRLNGTISDAMMAITTLLADMKLRSSTEDVLVTVGNAYLLLRPLRAMPTLVLFASFDRETATLGLLRAQVGRLAQDFGVTPG